MKNVKNFIMDNIDSQGEFRWMYHSKLMEKS